MKTESIHKFARSNEAVKCIEELGYRYHGKSSDFKKVFIIPADAKPWEHAYTIYEDVFAALEALREIELNGYCNI